MGSPDLEHLASSAASLPLRTIPQLRMRKPIPTTICSPAGRSRTFAPVGIPRAGPEVSLSTPSC